MQRWRCVPGQNSAYVPVVGPARRRPKRYGRFVVSAIGRLLDELSWEGNARKYRGGGNGLENVLTTEVFQALDLLPREAFLGRVLRAAEPAGFPTVDARVALANAAERAEDSSVEVLPGDLLVPDVGIKAQPDVVIESASSYVFVEAKRIRGGSFQEEQLARELVLAATHGQGRQPLLLLVLGEPPPIAVKGQGRFSIEDAIAAGVDAIEQRLGRPVRDRAADTAVAYLTWAGIAEQVDVAMGAYANLDPSTAKAVERIAAVVIDAVARHS